MLRAVSILPPGHGEGAPVDTIVLQHDERRLRRKLLTFQHGTEVMVDFPQTVTLEHRSGLKLDDGRIVEITAAAELLYAVTARDTEVQIDVLSWPDGITDIQKTAALASLAARGIIGR